MLVFVAAAATTTTGSGARRPSAGAPSSSRRRRAPRTRAARRTGPRVRGGHGSPGQDDRGRQRPGDRVGERGEADVVLAHSPEAAEEELMASGKAGDRRIGHAQRLRHRRAGGRSRGIEGGSPTEALEADRRAQERRSSRAATTRARTRSSSSSGKAGASPAALATRRPARAWARRCGWPTSRSGYADRSRHLPRGRQREGLVVLVEGTTLSCSTSTT